jgi:hypothetical protein
VRRVEFHVGHRPPVGGQRGLARRRKGRHPESVAFPVRHRILDRHQGRPGQSQHGHAGAKCLHQRPSRSPLARDRRHREVMQIQAVRLAGQLAGSGIQRRRLPGCPGQREQVNCWPRRATPTSASRPSTTAPMRSTSAARLRRARQGRQQRGRHRAWCARAPLQRRIFVTLNTILRDDELEPRAAGLAAVRRRRGRADRAGHGPAGARPAAHPAARQHADRHPHAREGALPAGRGLLADGAGARADAGQIRAIRAEVQARDAGVLHPRRAVRGLQRPVLHQPRAHRPQRQPRQLLAGLPPALHR